MQELSPDADYLFEVSFEVCNKVGGIYRVLESKASEMVDRYGEGYMLIGPYFIGQDKGEFKQEAPNEELKKVFDELAEEGINCYYGRWMVKGKPKTILVDFQNFYHNKNEIKKILWEDYGIDSLNAGNMFEEPVVWSWAVGRVIEKISKNLSEESSTVAHFHEWLSGAGLLYLDKINSDISTVFTTHATSLGRTLTHNDVDFYSELEEIDPDKLAYENNIHSKHQIEKATARFSDVLTTVSDITGMETENFLGRVPDIILPNGLNLEKFLTFEEIVIKHRLQRRKLREFTISYFFPYYKFDIENTLFYFIVGRNEYEAKGIDVFIKALARLNEKIKEDDQNEKTIVAYFWIPADVKSVKRELVENIEFLQDVKESLDDMMPEIEEKILYNLLYEEDITTENTISDNYFLELEKKLLRLNRKKDKPSISTHDLTDPNDRILKSLKENGLTNNEEDPVKVVYYPVYLTGHDGLSNLNYQEALEASHLGVFPSFYEPWGYTPLETAALGVASVTTDLAGFGRYRQTLKEKDGKEGVYVLERHNKPDSDVVRSLANHMYNFSKFERPGRVDNKIEARKVASEADWKDFIENYIEAHNKSLK